MIRDACEIHQSAMQVTFSWDDGHPHDLLIAELMGKYDIQGTFYCPIVNREGRPVLSHADLRRLAASPNAEIGAHTHSHAYASRLPVQEWIADCQQGKDALEGVLGQSVRSFCYPGGKYSDVHVEAVRRQGFLYGRTTANFSFSAGVHPLTVPTTLQFYPHRTAVLARNYVRHFRTHRGASISRGLLAASTFEQRIQYLVESCTPESGGLLHIWGHSWEIMEMDLLGALEGLFRSLRERLPAHAFITNQTSFQG